eukprot:2110748-Rhodomonas_salina.3
MPLCEVQKQRCASIDTNKFSTSRTAPGQSLPTIPRSGTRDAPVRACATLNKRVGTDHLRILPDLSPALPPPGRRTAISDCLVDSGENLHHWHGIADSWYDSLGQYRASENAGHDRNLLPSHPLARLSCQPCPHDARYNHAMAASGWRCDHDLITLRPREEGEVVANAPIKLPHHPHSRSRSARQQWNSARRAKDQQGEVAAHLSTALLQPHQRTIPRTYQKFA